MRPRVPHAIRGIPGGQGVSPWSEADVVNPDLVRQGLHIDPEQSRGGRLLPPGVSEGLDDGEPFDLGEGKGRISLPRRKLRGRTDIGRKIFRPDDRARGEEDEPLDGVSQLPDVAWPRISHEELKRFGREGFGLLTRQSELAEEVLDQTEDVLPPVPEGRDLEAHHVQTEKEVLPEATGAHLLLKLLVRRGEDPCIDPFEPGPPHAPQLAGVKDLEELGLHRRTHLGHLIQKDGPPVRHLKKPGLGAHGTRKGPLFVAEQFALQELILKGAAIDHQKRTIRPRTGPVDRSRDEPLTRPSLAGDEHRGVRSRHSPCRLEQDAHGFTFPENHRGMVRLTHHPAQGRILLLELPLLGRTPQDRLDLREFKGLGQVIVGAELHRLDGAVNLGVAREHPHLGSHPATAKPSQGFHSSEAGHSEIKEHHIEILLIQDLESLLPVVDGDHRAATLREFPLHEDSGRLFIIDHEHLYGTFLSHAPVRLCCATTGSRIATVVPFPTPSLLTSIEPPCCSIIPWQIASPSPVPLPTPLVVKKGSRTLARCSGGIPDPVSWTRISTCPEVESAVIRTSPSPSIASRALVTRFRITC